MYSSMIDYHVHSHFSIDSSTPSHKFCAGAVDLQLQEIGFSEHVDLDPQLSGYDALDFPAYHCSLTALQNQYPLPIRCGVEFSYQSSLEDGIRDYITSKPVDYAIGSVHEVEGRTMGSDFFEISSPGEYFKEVKKMVCSGLCDIVGHLEYFKQWGAYDWTCYEKEIREILELIIEYECALEINTAGFRHGCGRPYPSYEIQQVYRDMGGKRISLGSDAHHAAHLAFHFPQVIDELKTIGFKEVVHIKKRKISLKGL